MTKAEALGFLATHQPMASDEQVEQQDLDQYDSARRLFLVESDEKCIPLFLGSFGEGSGYGIYQLVEDVIARYPTDKVVPHLKEALASPHRSVRYWSAQIAARFPSPALVSELSECLTGDIDLRAASVTALGEIDDPGVVAILREAAERETDEDVIEILDDAIARKERAE